MTLLERAAVSGCPDIFSNHLTLPQRAVKEKFKKVNKKKKKLLFLFERGERRGGFVDGVVVAVRVVGAPSVHDVESVRGARRARTQAHAFVAHAVPVWLLGPMRRARAVRVTRARSVKRVQGVAVAARARALHAFAVRASAARIVRRQIAVGHLSTARSFA